MRSAACTLGITVAASLGLHGGLLLLTTAAITVLPAWAPGPARSSGRKLHVTRAFKAGDKYLLSCRVENDLIAPKSGKLLIALQGLWEIQEVTPQTGQPLKYTFTVDGSEVITASQAGVMFRNGAVISGFVDQAGTPAWTVDGTPVKGAMKGLFRNALPLPAAGDRDELASMLQPQRPVASGDTWTPDLTDAATRLTKDGFQLSGPVSASVTLSEPMEWDGEIPGRQLQASLNCQAGGVPGLPAGSELQSATVKSEGEIFLPNDPSLPLLREKWVTAASILCKLPDMAQAGPLTSVVTIERELSFYIPDKTEPQEVEITFVPQAEVPVVPAKLPRAAETAKEEPKPKPKPKGPIHIVTRQDIPSVAPFESDTPFISNRNTRAAASNAPAAGGDPRIGSQEGIELPGLSLFNAHANPGGESTPPPPPPPAPSPAALTEATPTPPPPAGDDRPPETATVRTDDPNAPAPPKKPGETPAMRDRPPDPVALSDTKPRPKPPTDPAKPAPKDTTPGKKPVVSSVKNRVEGSLSVHGKDSSVDAKDTPEGRFYSGLHDSIGLLWNTRLATVHGLSGSGVVEVEFDIDVNGRISNVKLVDPGKANPVLEDVCLTSVIKAKVPPLPASLKRAIEDPLTGGKLHEKINFYKIPRP